MELPIIPILIGGAVIMSIISWAEDNLKDDNKKTLKHWNKDSPARTIFKTVVKYKFDKNISDKGNNDNLRNIHKDLKTLAMRVLGRKFNKVMESGMDGNFETFMKDIVDVKNDDTFMKTLGNYAEKLEEYIPPDKSEAYKQLLNSKFSLGLDYVPTESPFIHLPRGRTKKRSRKRSKKRSKKKSKKKSRKNSSKQMSKRRTRRR